MRKSFLILAVLAAALILGLTSQNAMAQGWVTGVVFDADGEPIAGAIVAIQSAARVRGERPYRNRTETNEDGTFGFRGVPAGRYAIAARARGVGGVQARIAVNDGEGTVVQLQIQEGRRGDRGEIETGQVAGTVINADNEPVENARVVLTPLNRGRRAPWNRGLRMATDENGAFNFEEVPVGDYVISAMTRDQGAARARVTVEADGVVRIQLQLQ